ncbi:hypothetical protein SAMD00019534_072340 [Acytostelium subglobosum LB1]|uniref:hypothetical protein n=1 Tax=Acytostelium subglobosum LB1 TaxID=1410327 RepID=UPI000645203F|nr:hypothetical protein SAMD00019534_072340 [Acytostelium subglobosum LB1]GAM24059.1 hypothetical protein SAMD00019534_072340 [Acytostelium subglobosum LB1]|eukprot:XP_012753095.1 hypothetical protein SAMD00019534_072340 [Acytostelium subglobosum LB1]
MNKLIIVALIALVSVASACSNTQYKTAAPVIVKTLADLTQQERTLHETKMQEIIDLSHKLVAAGQITAIFTASIVDPATGKTLCMTGNNGARASILHGETNVILNCSDTYPGRSWKDHYLYTTGEPCPMCQSAIMWSGFQKVIYATSIKTLYCDKCMTQILIDSNVVTGYGYGLETYNAAYTPLEIIGGVLANVTDNTVFENYCVNKTFWTSKTPLCNADYNPKGCSSAIALGSNMYMTVFVALVALIASLAL